MRCIYKGQNDKPGPTQFSQPDMYEAIQNLNSIRFNSTQLSLNSTELNVHDVGHGRELNKNPTFMVVNRVYLKFNCL